ncbi:nucleolar and spindle-associated protein 1 isoform X2 [Synchiropus splendidus]|uniref:nucleolar and spindle-associated protein 1 isoform X2 n=1 Tax=Synchiropus splendidus TaxID=270530 RepID=UPI00237D3EA1|nr:nucleolar and spindle-associated protein 1 isoform X2 [Synchiropus splendidus]
MDEDLDSMKYADLQKLAKKLGIKARMKADKLLKAVKQRYEQEKEAEERDESTVDTVETPAQEDDQVQPESSHPTVFVNTRRGRGKAMKRKSSLETESKDLLSSDGDDTLPLEDLQPSAVSSPKSGDKEVSTPGISKAKKRRVSTENSSKLQPEIHHEAPGKCDTGRPQEKALHAAKSGGIPRLKKAKTKTFTPNFKKMHEAQFNKMESIDSYVQRKNKQMEMLKSSAKETQAIPGRTSMFSPALSNKRPVEDKRRLTYSAAKKEDVPFRPSVLSTRRINVRFSEATRDNEYKGSLIKTPARMSPCVTSITPKTNDVGKLNNSRTSMLSTSKTNGTFVFSANTTATPGTQKKPTFDLKASLSRPLGYKPHTGAKLFINLLFKSKPHVVYKMHLSSSGKLKPFGETKENAKGNKSLIMNTHEKNYKQHRVQTREVRREKQTEERKQKKDNMLGARRGLVMM